MAEYTGGLRHKLIRESFAAMIRESLTELGWFSSTLQAKPVVLLTEQYDASSEIKPNAIGISNEGMMAEEWEMGSTLEETRWQTYLDIFAEDESIGVHLSGDLYDIIRGKIAGRVNSDFRVYDYSKPENLFLFYCQLENVEIARVREWNQPFNRYWWVIGCEIVDYYSGERA